MKAIINLNPKVIPVLIASLTPPHNTLNRSFPMIIFGNIFRLRGEYSLPCMFNFVYTNTNPSLKEVTYL